jgi:hypothetical protein
MDMYTLTNLGSLVGPIIAVGGVVYTWLTSRATQNSTEIKELTTRLVTAEAQLQALDTALKQVPDKDTVHELDIKVTQLTGTIGVVNEAVQAVQRTAQRIEQFLLDQAKR